MAKGGERQLRADIAAKVARGERVRLRISASAIASLPDLGRDYRVLDSEVPGLTLRVRAAGTARYVYRYKLPDRTDRALTLGDVAALSPDQARALAREAAVEKARGSDPVERKAQSRRKTDADRMPLSELLERWLDRPSLRTGRPRSPKTVLEWRGLIRREIAPALGDKRVVAITRVEVERFHRARQSKPHTANRCLEILRSAFKLAEIEELRPVGSDPTAFIPKYVEPKRKDQHPVRLPEARAYVAAIAKAEAASKSVVASSAATAVLFCALTGARIGEARSLKWAGVSKEGHHAAVDGKIGRRVLDVPMLLADRLRTLKEHATGPHVFAGADGQSAVSYSALHDFHRRVIEQALADRDLDEETAERVKGMRIHDLRHAFLYAAGERAVNAMHLRDAAGHANVTMTSEYLPKFNEPVAALVEATARALVGD